MQPSMVISAPGTGMIYINGRFAGECGPETPLMRPVNPTGAAYIEYRPLEDGFLPMARRLVFSGGRPMAQSIESAGSVRAVCWPGGITEIELTPAAAAPDPPLVFEAGGLRLVLDGQKRLCRGEQVLAQLPPGAGLPEYMALGHGGGLMGHCSDGMYLVTGNREFSHSNGFLQAKRIEAESDGRIRAMIDRGDLVGHGSLETWRLEDEGLRMISSEPSWVNGSPRWPKRALDTVLAAVEAELAGLRGEAEGYLSPALRARSPLEKIAERCDLCGEMKYGLPDGRPCAALIRLEGEAIAAAEPLYYRVSPSGGLQGAYQIEALELADD